MPLTKLQFRPGINRETHHTAMKVVGLTWIKCGFALVILKKLAVGSSNQATLF